MQSELAVLVETEARLDRALGAARASADRARAAARERAAQAAEDHAAELAREQERIAAEVRAQTQARIAALEEAAARTTARYEAVRGERLDYIAHRVALRLVELVLEEGA